MAKKPSEIKLGDVVRFVDGPIEPIACVVESYKDCRDISRCVFRSIWQEINRKTAEILDSITFEDLVKKAKHTSGAFIYQI